MVGAFRISTQEERDYVLKGNALIRSRFQVVPEELEEEKWAQLVGEAIWLEYNSLHNLAEMLVAVFCGNDGGESVQRDL